MSVYFPPGTTSDGVGINEVTAAKQGLANDINSGLRETQAQRRWNNLRRGKHPEEERHRARRNASQASSRKDGARSRQSSSPGQFGSQAGQAADTIEQQPQATAMTSAIKPEDVMRFAADLGRTSMRTAATACS